MNCGAHLITNHIISLHFDWIRVVELIPNDAR